MAYVFDLLYLNGKDLTQSPLIKRKEQLHSLLRHSKQLRYSDHVVGQLPEKLAENKVWSTSGIHHSRLQTCRCPCLVPAVIWKRARFGLFWGRANGFEDSFASLLARRAEAGFRSLQQCDKECAAGSTNDTGDGAEGRTPSSA